MCFLFKCWQEFTLTEFSTVCLNTDVIFLLCSFLLLLLPPAPPSLLLMGGPSQHPEELGTMVVLITSTLYWPVVGRPGPSMGYCNRINYFYCYVGYKIWSLLLLCS